MQIHNYFNQLYPFYYRNRKNLFIILLLFSFISFLFSYLFQPFEVNIAEHKINSNFILLIHAFIPLPIVYIYFWFVNKNVKNETSWTIGKEIFHLSIVLLLIGISDFLIRDFIYTNPDNWSFKYFFEEIRNTFLVGVLLLLIILPLNLQRLLKIYQKRATKLNIKKVSNSQNLDSVYINSSINSENFNLHIHSFLFAKVDGNYAEIYTKSKNNFNKKLIRLSLKELEVQLKDFNFIFKTHRSYLVNLNQIKTVNGNAQGYKIKLHNFTSEIPVSRSKIKEFDSLLT
ncbi:LytR/AlgR family response regulator transcription factor [Polaribacter reichenbachii]|uniref:LytR/AlgR family response regulator transcription factor n=1 Tax=Polaribacter reichenbachii TaxID=996801 RepID=UPI000B2D5E74|nr:LytTR family transcriptional regulator DNA-binding domain-containing protein [Polaribacter reichenbachii]